jgi:PAS domain S-box-containing protein
MLKMKLSKFFSSFPQIYQWHVLFFTIAVLAISAISISIFISQENRKQFTDLTAEKKRAQLARKTLNRFNTQLLELDLVIHGSSKNDPAQVFELFNNLHKESEQLKLELNEIFASAKASSTERQLIAASLVKINEYIELLATELKSPKNFSSHIKTDRLNIQLNEQVEDIRKVLIDFELAKLTKFEDEFIDMARFETILGILLLSLLLIVSGVGLWKILKLENKTAIIHSHSNSLKAANQRLEYVLEGARLGAWDWWITTNEVSFDRRWMSMLGLKLEEEPQELKTWSDRVHPEDLANCYKVIKSHLEGHTEVYESIHRMRHKNGKWVWILDRGKISERDANGKPIRLTGTHFDITDFVERDLLSKEIQSIANIGGWELDVATNMVRWTEEVYKIHGLPIGTPINKELAISFYALSDQERILHCVDECERGKSYVEIFEFIDAHSKRKWVKTMGIPIFGSDGKVVKLRGTFQDITAQKRAEDALQAEQDRFRRLVQNSPGMVYEFKMEPTGKAYFPYASPKGFELYELDPEEFWQNPSIMLELAAPEQKDVLNEAITESAKNLTPFEWHGQIQTKMGKRKDVIARSTPILLPDGSILWEGILIDVSKQVATERALEEERVKALHASKLASLGEVSAGIAHEINNPLTVISGNLPLLKKYLGEPELFQKKIDTMSRAVERISKIVYGLKKFSRSSSSREMRHEKLAKIFEEIQILTQSKVSHHSAKIEYKIDGDLQILCNEIEIEQVFVNLINNACDAIADLESKWIRIEAKAEENGVCVRVTDSGSGIPEPVKERLFQPFFTTKPVGKGTGLGLSISKGILDSHKAEISINEKVGNTCFEIRFPNSIV